MPTKTLEAVKRILLNACALFTLLVFMLSFFLILWEEFNSAFTPGLLLKIFAFSTVISAASMILHIEKIPKIALFGIHLLACYADFFLFFIVFSNKLSDASFIIVGTIVFIIAYAIFIAALFGIYALFQAGKSKSLPYASQFRQVDDLPTKKEGK